MQCFDTQTLQFIALFESLSKTKVRDCLIKDSIYVVVEENAARVIGKGGQRIKQIEQLVHKPIRVFEYSDNLEQFVRNLLPCLEVKAKDGVVEAKVQLEEKVRLMGRGKRYLKVLEEILQRNHGVERLLIK